MKTSRNVVVTGGSGGIGRQIVRRFTDAGDRVTVLDKNRDALDALVRGDPEAGIQALQVDVSDERSVAEAFQRAELAGVSWLAGS